MKPPQNAVSVSLREEFDSSGLSTIFCVVIWIALSAFGDVDKWPKVKFPLAVNEVYAGGRRVRMLPLLRLIAVWRNKTCQHHHGMDCQQKPDGPSKFKANVGRAQT